MDRLFIQKKAKHKECASTATEITK